MLTIRLSRIGKRKKPMYRLIISEKARDPYGRALEILGSYNPFTKELQAKKDRIQYWLSQGSGMSATVNNLLIEKGIIEGKKIKASKLRKKKKDSKKQEVKPKSTKEDKKSEEKDLPAQTGEKKDEKKDDQAEEKDAKKTEKKPEEKKS